MLETEGVVVLILPGTLGLVGGAVVGGSTGVEPSRLNHAYLEPCCGSSSTLLAK